MPSKQMAVAVGRVMHAVPPLEARCLGQRVINTESRAQLVSFVWRVVAYNQFVRSDVSLSTREWRRHLCLEVEREQPQGSGVKAGMLADKVRQRRLSNQRIRARSSTTTRSRRRASLVSSLPVGRGYRRLIWTRLHLLQPYIRPWPTLATMSSLLPPNGRQRMTTWSMRCVARKCTSNMTRHC